MEKELRVNNFDLLRIVALTFVAGLLSWRLVEKPFLKLKDRFKSSAAMEPDGIVVAVGP